MTEEAAKPNGVSATCLTCVNNACPMARIIASLFSISERGSQ